MRTDYLPFHVPEISEAEIRSVEETLRSGWLTTGPKARQFEEAFGRYVGSPHAVAVSSGTAALHLALEAVGVGAGDEVIVPAMTFAATAEVVQYLQARPVLVDCRWDTLNIDPDRVEKAITERTKAIVPVHFAGQPCEMDRLLEVARHHRVKIVEDAAHALPARDRGRTIGTIGDVTCFSFYATKTITTGEGGMATTSDAELADRMRVMRLHGISQDAWKRYSAEGSWFYEILAAGYKYNLTDIAAAIGIEQLRRCDQFWESRRRIAAMYDEAFVDLPEIQRPFVRSDVQHAWHLYVIQLELDRLTVTRNGFLEQLRAAKIGTSVHFIPLHLHPLYRERFGYRPDDCPTASAVFERIVSLPIYPRMQEADVEDVAHAIRQIVGRSRR